MTEILFQSATAAAQAMAERRVSARELTEELLSRIEAVNPALNAVVELRAEQALDEADAADRAIGDGSRKPLLGVPMTIKEAFNVAGMRTTWGNPAFADFRADSDATVVERLRGAGAIVVGKTNVQFMLADFAQTSNEIYGTTVNPWDPELTPGGSSGGSAAATASGLTFLEYGSDLVGSIRIPASFCGVYGLRPSAGIVPLTGFQVPYAPAEPSETTYMSALGPFGRSLADVRTALTVTAGPEAPADRGYSWTLAPPRHAHLADYRVGIVLDDAGAPVSSELTGVLSEAVEAITGAGATLVEGWPEGVDPMQGYKAFGYHVELFFAFQDPDSRFERLPELIEQEKRRMAFRSAWNRYFGEIDVFLCPVNFTPAFPHDTRPFDERTIVTPEGERAYGDQPFWTSHAALSGLPALAAPVGLTPSGLPVGLQIVGPLYEDDTALTFAELLAREIGGYEQPI